MARSSSKIGFLNIETTKTSSHQKIKSEIEAIEATKDSSEVCSLEKKECDEIIEHLKNNPRLVVKSLGSEQQIVLHVAIMVNETTKPKSPTSKGIDKELKEAPTDSDWYDALKYRDCKKLVTLLKTKPWLVVQTGPEGITILHVAAYRGCIDLLDQVFYLFKYDNKFLLKFVDKMSRVKVDLSDLLKAKWGLFEANVQNMAWFTVPRHILDFTYSYDPKWWSLKLSYKRFDSGTSQHLMDKIIKNYGGEPAKKSFYWFKYWGERDLDYNFVLERKELQFHYACEHMWSWNKYGNDTLEKYVKIVIDGCRELGPLESLEVLIYLFQLHNAQGQTPLHLALNDNGGIAQLLKLLPLDDAYTKCLDVRDVRGWTVLHYCVATGNQDDLKTLLRDKQVDVDARTSILGSDHKEVGMAALHLAILHNHVEIVKLLLQHPHIDINALFYRPILCGYERSWTIDDHKKLLEKTYWSPLQLAAIMDLSNIVRELFGLLKTSLAVPVWRICDGVQLEKRDSTRPNHTPNRPCQGLFAGSAVEMPLDGYQSLKDDKLTPFTGR